MGILSSQRRMNWVTGLPFMETSLSGNVLMEDYSLLATTICLIYILSVVGYPFIYVKVTFRKRVNSRYILFRCLGNESEALVTFYGRLYFLLFLEPSQYILWNLPSLEPSFYRNFLLRLSHGRIELDHGVPPDLFSPVPH